MTPTHFLESLRGDPQRAAAAYYTKETWPCVAQGSSMIFLVSMLFLQRISAEQNRRYHWTRAVGGQIGNRSYWPFVGPVGDTQEGPGVHANFLSKGKSPKLIFQVGLGRNSLPKSFLGAVQSISLRGTP